MCTCTCCADALERVRCDRVLLDACTCHLYLTDEQCDCDFCLWAVARRGEMEEP